MSDSTTTNTTSHTKQGMLTTADNPFNPHTEWDEWYTWDEAHGYHTCSYLARVAATSPYLTDVDNNQSIADAMAEIVKFNLTGNYKIVYE